MKALIVVFHLILIGVAFEMPFEAADPVWDAYIHFSDKESRWDYCYDEYVRIDMGFKYAGTPTVNSTVWMACLKPSDNSGHLEDSNYGLLARAVLDSNTGYYKPEIGGTGVRTIQMNSTNVVSGDESSDKIFTNTESTRNTHYPNFDMESYMEKDDFDDFFSSSIWETWRNPFKCYFGESDFVWTEEEDFEEHVYNVVFMKALNTRENTIPVDFRVNMTTHTEKTGGEAPNYDINAYIMDKRSDYLTCRNLYNTLLG
jgi:hypothetical protein